MVFGKNKTSKGEGDLLRKMNLIQSYLNSQVYEKSDHHIAQVFVGALRSVWENHFWGFAFRPENRGRSWRTFGFETEISLKKEIENFLEGGRFSPDKLDGPFSMEAPPPLFSRYKIKILYFFPVRHAEKHFGFLFLGLSENNKIPEEQEAVLETLTKHLGFIFDTNRTCRTFQRINRILKERIRRRIHQVKRMIVEKEAVFRVQKAASVLSDMGSLFEEIASAVKMVIHFDEMGLLLPSPNGTELECFIIHIENKQIHSNSILVVPQTGTVGEWILKSKKSFYMREINDLKPFPFCYENCSINNIQSYCAFPLMIRERVIGVVTYASKEPGRFPSETVPFMEDLSQSISLVLENHKAELQKGAKNRISLMENVYIQRKIKAEPKFKDIIGKSQVIQEVLKRVEVVAKTESSVLITGETGTGKELFAKAIFQLSPRKNKSLITVNCASLPPGLVESELFGHEKGAFTGAIIRKVGRFELANAGTIFLDEIGDLPKDVQAKLLRVLQHREFERVGGTKTLKVDVRLIAATNRDLAKFIGEDGFRPDLFYRLNVFPIDLPPLRERKEDIPELVYYFIKKYSEIMNKKITEVERLAMDKLVAYPWPGNVRELEHMIERAVILCTGTVLEINEEVLTPSGVTDPPDNFMEIFNSRETKKIGKDENFLKILDQVGGNRSKAAQILGISRTTLWRKLKDLGAPVIFLFLECLPVI